MSDDWDFGFTAVDDMPQTNFCLLYTSDAADE